MRTIINYIRQWFCKHKFKYEEKHVTSSRDVEDNDKAGTYGMKVSRTWSKCEWHTDYWKYL